MNLSKDWITQGLIDFEYKKYLLLAYLQGVRGSFEKVELYPHLAELVFHYRNLQDLKKSKLLLRDAFPKELSLDDLQKLEISYRMLVEDDAVMEELETIIDYALPQFKNSLQEGSSIYEHVESQCEISPIGVTPLYANEGYLFVSQPPEKETDIYRYQISIFEDSNEQYRGLQTTYVETQVRSLASTYENIKLGLVRRYKDFPNPATFLALSKSKFPQIETLLPVVKRLFVKHLSKVA
jgi:hypothetical protein